ncbi:MAG TPA: hypothetical protein VGO55_09805 [Allosphingosinicella sp.]|jgi:hypothetical protein|nr:hypothetical protein [Allosphingosinicella sp.]
MTSRAETTHSAIVVAYVNLPGGYTWLSETADDVPAEVRSGLRKAIEDSFQSRRSFPVSGLLPDGSYLDASIVYDDKAGDETGREGLIFIVGAHSKAGASMPRPIPRELVDALRRCRAEIMQGGMDRDSALAAFQAELAKVGQSIRRATIKIDDPDRGLSVGPEQERPIPAWPRSIVWLLWIQTICLLAITLMMALILVGSLNGPAQDASEAGWRKQPDQATTRARNR